MTAAPPDPAETAIPTPEPTPYEAWRATGNTMDLNKVVSLYHNEIAGHLHRYGLGNDPLAAGQARVYAARAIKTYDPASGASMKTWIDRNMQPLSRFKRSRATAVKVPEQMQLDNWTINKATVDFEENHDGREPELDELADHSGLTVKRINDVRQGFRKMTSESPFEGNVAGTAEPDYLSESLEATWREGDKLDRKIIEMKTGFGGKFQPMKPKDIALELGISPVVLSRRSARLGAKIEEMLESLETT